MYQALDSSEFWCNKMFGALYSLRDTVPTIGPTVHPFFYNYIQMWQCPINKKGYWIIHNRCHRILGFCYNLIVILFYRKMHQLNQSDFVIILIYKHAQSIFYYIQLMMIQQGFKSFMLLFWLSKQTFVSSQLNFTFYDLKLFQCLQW